jgi:hypothetical protein
MTFETPCTAKVKRAAPGLNVYGQRLAPLVGENASTSACIAIDLLLAVVCGHQSDVVLRGSPGNLNCFWLRWGLEV